MQREEQKRFNQKKVALLISIFVAIWIPFLAVNQASADQENPCDMLIIYSSGNPFKNISDMSPKEVDAVTTPTPIQNNCRNIAEQLAFALRDKNFVVRVASAIDIKHRNEILRARLVVLGSPARFWNVSWQMKKLFDVQFAQIYVSEGRLRKKRIAAFSMAEIDASARAALKAIKAVVADCKGQFGPTMTYLTKHSKKEVRKRINRFADKLAAAVKYH